MKFTFAPLFFSALAAASDGPIPPPAIDVPRATGKQTAVFAGGCFWCTEAVCKRIKGVEKVVPGYAGGSASDAKYPIVGSGATNHAEAVEVTFDPAVITYGQLLRIFFSAAHDPTQLNRQGPDSGRQYRSAIFYANEDQKKVAEAYIRQLNAAKVFPSPIVTEVAPLNGFYPAESYHMDYAAKNPMNPYIMINANPKVKKLEQQYPDLVKK